MPSLTACALLLILFAFASQCNAKHHNHSTLVVNLESGWPISEHFFGVFFEELNHAGSGGLWSELVSNRGFEAGGTSVPSRIYPWSIVGNESTIRVETKLASMFPRNKVAVKLDILCESPKDCPHGVGLSNPGFWGMSIEEGEKYNVVFYVRALGPIDLKISFKGALGQQLASTNIRASAKDVSKWRKMESILEAIGSDFNSSLHITTTKKGVIWLDQVSAMPMETQNGHGFRKDLYQRVADLKPKFFRFPGGTYVEGQKLRNAFRWKETIGSWENRPGHFNDPWNYWTDDGLGFLEMLQLAEDLDTLPIWVFNAGVARDEGINTTEIGPFVQEALDGIEFAKGPITSKWGKIRASMGHPKPFNLQYVAVGNEDCDMYEYQGNYLKFYKAIKHHYPDMQIISNCDATVKPLDHPADLFDFHMYTTAEDMFSQYNKFDSVQRVGPKAFVSEYAVWKEDAGFGYIPLICFRRSRIPDGVGEEQVHCSLNQWIDLVEMVSYAPLLVNYNDQKWRPDAIVFDSYRSYVIPSYWLQQLFTQSSGATYVNSKLEAPASVVASAIVWKDKTENKSYLRIKAVNFANRSTILSIKIDGLDPNVDLSGSSLTLLTSEKVRDENSFYNPVRVVPVRSILKNAKPNMNIRLPPISVVSIDFPK